MPLNEPDEEPVADVVDTFDNRGAAACAPSVSPVRSQRHDKKKAKKTRADVSLAECGGSVGFVVGTREFF